MATSCAIVDCLVRDGARVAQNDRKVTRPLPSGPLPEGMACSRSPQCRICNKCYQKITRFQTEERGRREHQRPRRGQVPLPPVSQRARKQDEVSSLRSSIESTEQLSTDKDSDISAKRLRSSSSSESATTTTTTTTSNIPRTTMEETPTTHECARRTDVDGMEQEKEDEQAGRAVAATTAAKNVRANEMKQEGKEEEEGTRGGEEGEELYH